MSNAATLEELLPCVKQYQEPPHRYWQIRCAQPRCGWGLTSPWSAERAADKAFQDGWSVRDGKAYCDEHALTQGLGDALDYLQRTALWALVDGKFRWAIFCAHLGGECIHGVYSDLSGRDVAEKAALAGWNTWFNLAYCPEHQP